MKSTKRLARSAGVLYLVMCVLGVVAHLVIRADVYVPGDAAATAANIVTSPGLFRFSLVADVAMATIFVFLGVTLHLLFRHVDRRAAGAMVVFVCVGAGMILMNLLYHHAALLVATGSAYPGVGTEPTDSLVLLLMDMHHYGYVLAGVFFGLWLLPLGFLAYKSGMFPPALGVLLIVAGGAWIVGAHVQFLWPQLPGAVDVILTAPTLAEFWMMLYLVTKGVRTLPKQAELVAAGV